MELKSNNICWICKRDKSTLEAQSNALIEIDGVEYSKHTICDVCYDILLSIQSNDDVEKRVKHIEDHLSGFDGVE